MLKMYLITMHESQISVCFVLWSTILSYWLFRDMCTKGTSCMFRQYRSRYKFQLYGQPLKLTSLGSFGALFLKWHVTRKSLGPWGKLSDKYGIPFTHSVQGHLGFLSVQMSQNGLQLENGRWQSEKNCNLGLRGTSKMYIGYI